MRSHTHNLCIDESGSGALYEPPPRNYQFFNMAGVLIDNESEKLLSSEIRKWKREHLINQFSTFHAVDVFEDYKTDYKKKSLDNTKSFYLATIHLRKVFSSIPYEAQVFYIDLKEMRRQMDFDRFITGKQNILKDIIHKEYQSRFLQPISTILEHHFCNHESYIKKNNQTGYVCFESQKEFDEQTIKTFHQTLVNHNKKVKLYEYGKSILGIHFDTKAALSASLELADFIAYCSTQLLRDQFKSSELNMKPERLSILLDIFKSLKKEKKIYLRNCTTDCIEELKSIYKPQKKASK